MYACITSQKTVLFRAYHMYGNTNQVTVYYMKILRQNLEYIQQNALELDLKIY